MPEQTHAEKLAEYIDAADRAAKSYAGQTQEIWWAALAATLREALADRQRIEILAPAAMPMTDRTMSPEQRVDGVVLEYLEHEWNANRQRHLPGRIVTETGLPRLVVARSIQRLRKLGWIAWETVPISRQPGWRPTSLGAMVAADPPRPYWQDENGTTWESREDATEHGPATEVIMTPSEFARLPEA